MKKTLLGLLIGTFLAPAVALADEVDMKTLKPSGAAKTLGAGVLGKVKGRNLIRRGKAKVKRGKRNVKQGEATGDQALVAKGKRRITKGNKMIQAGRKKKLAGDRAFMMGKEDLKSKFKRKPKAQPKNEEN